MDNMLSNAIDKVLTIARQPAAIFTIDGYDHIDTGREVRLFTPPVAGSLTVKTLDGFVGLLEQDFETFGADGVNAIVQVKDHTSVRVIGRTSDRFGRRREFFSADYLAPDRTFAFNQYQSQENFIIGMRTAFVQTPAVDELVKTIGNLASQAEVRQEDDGMTQTATTKAGVVLKGEKTINPRVGLQPYRTFLEVEQPTSDYIVRLKVAEVGTPSIALFDADAGFWKLEAMDRIQKWLQQRIKTSEVVAINSLPVVA